MDGGEARQLRRQAAALRERGDAVAAAGAERAALAAAARDPLLLQAASALNANDIPSAERLLKGRLKDDPLDTAAMRLLAEVAARIGRFGDSEVLLRRAIELSPDFAEARLNLAVILNRQGRAAEALAELDRIDAIAGASDPTRTLRAACLSRVGGYDEALALYRDLLTRRPGEPRLLLSVGHLEKTLGDEAAAVAAYRAALARDPSLGEAWWSLANMKTVRFDATDRAAMERGLAAEGGDPDQRLQLHFALGQWHESAGEAEPAFRHFAIANAMRAELVPYDAATERHVTRRWIELATPTFFAERAGAGDPDPAPIFILGMPRAGSTLIEQILASHSMVEGTMELPDINLAARETRRLSDGASYPDSVVPLEPEQLRALGQRYLADTRIHRKLGRPCFIDKMPNNWQHFALIRLILPNARIIDARRHPLDCGWSNFKQHFARGQQFAYALETIGTYYADYVGLMAHLDRVQPGSVHRVIHERLLDDPETEIRALLAFCGLPFEPACLEFHRTERPVRTASAQQVRQPLSKAGVGRWKPFEPWLGPLKAALGDVLDSWDDAARP